MNDKQAAREAGDAAMSVHWELGPGLLESAYAYCLAYERVRRGLKVERQKEMPVVYHGVKIDAGYRLDLLVEDVAVVELKAADRWESNHEVQILSGHWLTRHRLGLLLNFSIKLLRNGIRRFVL